MISLDFSHPANLSPRFAVSVNHGAHDFLWLAGCIRLAVNFGAKWSLRCLSITNWRVASPIASNTCVRSLVACALCYSSSSRSRRAGTQSPSSAMTPTPTPSLWCPPTPFLSLWCCSSSRLSHVCTLSHAAATTLTPTSRCCV